MRIGHGYDIHAHGPGDHIVLGGVRIPHSHGLVAHSDGDAVAHALCDAMLGAAGLGDIGQLFPDNDPQHANQDSLFFVREVAKRLGENGYLLVNADITVIAEAPKLATHIPAMRDTLAAALKVSRAVINVKATSNEGLGALGRREGIAAHAVVLLDRSA